MPTPDEQLPTTGTAEHGSAHDPEAAEAYAESVSIDPSPDEIDEYFKIAGGEPLHEQPKTTPTTNAGE
ncbi:MAG: hypothetical protein ACRDS0_19225 [Pseudonocardiaceae bacterium]